MWVQLPGSGPENAWTTEDDKLADQLRPLLRQGKANAAGWQEVARRLADQRLKPLEEYLRGAGRPPSLTSSSCLRSGYGAFRSKR